MNCWRGHGHLDDTPFPHALPDGSDSQLNELVVLGIDRACDEQLPQLFYIYFLFLHCVIFGVV